MIKLKYGQRNRTLRKRKSKGKLFRKKCEGCIVFRNHNEDGSTCPVPYKYMSSCPCQPCLVKVMCTRFCDKFNS